MHCRVKAIQWGHVPYVLTKTYISPFQVWSLFTLNKVICFLFVCFVSLRPLNNLSVMRDGSSWVEPVLS